MTALSYLIIAFKVIFYTDLSHSDQEVRTCGEQLLNDLWRYHIKSNKWTYIKPDYNRDAYINYISPSARYGHSSAYVEIEERDKYKGQNLTRKYLYIYGGISFECENACSDLWRFEIPWAPQRYYPQPIIGNWWNRGNHWTLMSNDSENSPGKRYKHVMIVDFNMRYIFLFGGIKFNSQGTATYMNDLWRYYLTNDKWEKVSARGINSVTSRVWEVSRLNYGIAPTLLYRKLSGIF